MTDAPTHEADLFFDCDDRERARLVARSVRQEVDEIADDRSRAAVTSEGRTVVVRVTAADLVALRAGLNTWTSLVEVAERAAEAGDVHGASASGASAGADGA